MSNEVSSISRSYLDNAWSEASLSVQRHKNQPAARKARLIVEDILGRNNRLRFNELSQFFEIDNREIEEYVWKDLHHLLDEKTGVLVTASNAQSAFQYVGNKNRNHPVREYLLEQAEQAPEIDLLSVASKCLGVTDNLSQTLVKKWLCGAVSKALESEGSPFIEVLTLISPLQGIGKSEFFRTLASSEWFNDSFSQTEKDVDRLTNLHSAWINEIAEIDQYASRKLDFKQFKALLSSEIDTLRVPYGKKQEKRPRRFAIGATANVEDLFPADDQQRRFWVIKVQPTSICRRLDIKWLEDNRDAIWGTVTRLYLKLGKEAFSLSDSQRDAVIARNASEFSAESPMENKILAFLQQHSIKAITNHEAWEKVLGNRTPQQRHHQMEIAGILRRAGYVKQKNYRKLNTPFNCIYVHPDRKHDFDPAHDYDSAQTDVDSEF